MNNSLRKKDFLKPRTRSSRQRLVDNLDMKQKFLIVCEGERTEPNYFKGFRVPKEVKDIDIKGLGYNTVSLVQETMKLKNTNQYDQVWCVFDRDSFSREHFNRALELAKANGINVAYSNEAFEIWYLLHYDFINSGISRTQYEDKLTEKINKPYKKNSIDMYQILYPRQQQAIKNATKLLEQYNPLNPYDDNPCTKVHLLVQALNEFIVKP